MVDRHCGIACAAPELNDRSMSTGTNCNCTQDLTEKNAKIQFHTVNGRTVIVLKSKIGTEQGCSTLGPRWLGTQHKPYFVKVEIEVPKYCRLYFRDVERFLAFTFSKSPSSADSHFRCWSTDLRRYTRRPACTVQDGTRQVAVMHPSDPSVRRTKTPLLVNWFIFTSTFTG
ncbi:unnamed protein product, partial [Nesidiocoris tenuis]